MGILKYYTAGNYLTGKNISHLGYLMCTDIWVFQLLRFTRVTFLFTKMGIIRNNIADTRPAHFVNTVDN